MPHRSPGLTNTLHSLLPRHLSSATPTGVHHAGAGRERVHGRLVGLPLRPLRPRQRHHGRHGESLKRQAGGRCAVPRCAVLGGHACAEEGLSKVPEPLISPLLRPPPSTPLPLHANRSSSSAALAPSTGGSGSGWAPPSPPSPSTSPSLCWPPPSSRVRALMSRPVAAAQGGCALHLLECACVCLRCLCGLPLPPPPSPSPPPRPLRSPSRCRPLLQAGHQRGGAGRAGGQPRARARRAAALARARHRGGGQAVCVRAGAPPLCMLCHAVHAVLCSLCRSPLLTPFSSLLFFHRLHRPSTSSRVAATRPSPAWRRSLAAATPRPSTWSTWLMGAPMAPPTA